MVYVEDLLKFIVKIINRFEEKDFQLIFQNYNYQLIEIEDLIDFKFEAREFISFDEMSFYLYDIIDTYPYLRGIISALNSLYSRPTRKYHISPNDEEMLINLVDSYKRKLDEDKNGVKKSEIKDNALHLLLRKIKKIIFKR